MLRIRAQARLDQIGLHADGLWGDRAPSERIHRAFTRIQSMRGHTSVSTAVRSGGRAPGDYTTLVPWGEAPQPRRDPTPPWPGRLPDPAPSQILPTPAPVRLGGATSEVRITERGVLSEEPRRIAYRTGRSDDIDAWAGPWIVDERWWLPDRIGPVARIQVTTEHSAYLLRYTGEWAIEATYD